MNGAQSGVEIWPHRFDEGLESDSLDGLQTFVDREEAAFVALSAFTGEYLTQNF